jgi:microcystin-dependent protein
MNKLLRFLILAFIAITPTISHAQQTQCWTLNQTTGIWTYNPACSQTPNSPLKVAVGKQLTVNNSIALSGQDYAALNIGTGGSLGTAAFTNSTQYQPAGGGVNVSVFYSGSLTIGTGTDYINITTSTGLSFTPNMWVLCAYVSNPTQYMYGYIDSYNSSTGALKITVPAAGSTGGSGTYSNWVISISGPIGPTGSTGPAGGPTGSIIAFAGSSSSLPSGYLLCDGTQYSCTTYAALCAVIGSTWGGDGSTTFNVPNLRGRFPLGAGQGTTAYNGATGTNRILGQYSNGDPNSGATIAGAETHGQTQAEMPSHTHTDSGHTHLNSYQWGGVAGGNANAALNGNGITNTSYYTGIGYANIQYTGGNSQMSIMNPFTVVNYIIHQ